VNATGTQRPDAFDVPTPAKVNLRLEVRGKRDDGYHELCTVMMAVDLTDRLRFSTGPAAGLELSVSDPALAAATRGTGSPATPRSAAACGSS